MGEVLLPFGMLDDGRMVAIESVARGLACECVCPQCKTRLVAVKGEIVTHHFRHHVEGAVCAGARETAIHLFAKQVICGELTLSLPTYPKTDLGPMRSASAERSVEGVRPDVLAEYESENVAVEIYVAHRVSREKITKISELNLATIEIDLSYYRNAERSEDEWKVAILHKAPREWLYPPLPIRLEIEHRAAERLAEAARDEREAKARAEALKLAAERVQEEQERAALERRALWAQRDLEFAERRRIAQEAVARNAALYQAMRKRAAAMRAPPSLQKLVEAHGNYNRITPEAWAQFDKDVNWWRAFVRNGGLYEARMGSR